MNKYLPLVFLLCVLLACNKADEKQPEEITAKSFKVNISVANEASSFVAIQSVLPSKTTLATGNALTSYVNNIYYRIYQADGKLLSSVKQTSATAGFGSIMQELPVGQYKVFIAASNSEILFVDNGGLPKDRFGFPGGWADIFTSMIPITVTTADVTQTIRLERLLGLLNITITDVIPSTVSRISISMQPETSYRYVNGSPDLIPVGTAYNFSITAGDVGVRNRSFSTFVGNTDAGINLNVKAYNYNNVIVAEKNIPNVTLTKNKKTQVSLQLFTP